MVSNIDCLVAELVPRAFSMSHEVGPGPNPSLCAAWPIAFSTRRPAAEYAWCRSRPGPTVSNMASWRFDDLKATGSAISSPSWLSRGISANGFAILKETRYVVDTTSLFIKYMCEVKVHFQRGYIYIYSTNRAWRACHLQRGHNIYCPPCSLTLPRVLVNHSENVGDQQCMRSTTIHEYGHWWIGCSHIVLFADNFPRWVLLRLSFTLPWVGTSCD